MFRLKTVVVFVVCYHSHRAPFFTVPHVRHQFRVGVDAGQLCFGDGLDHLVQFS